MCLLSNRIHKNKISPIKIGSVSRVINPKNLLYKANFIWEISFQFSFIIIFILFSNNNCKIQPITIRAAIGVKKSYFYCLPICIRLKTWARMFKWFCCYMENPVLPKNKSNITSSLTFKNPMRHGWGDAFNSFSRRSQNSSGSTFMSTNSCISFRTFLSTGLGSLLDNSNKLAKNLRHFSLVVSDFATCWEKK